MDEKQDKQVRPEVDKSILTKDLIISGLICDKPCWLYSLSVSEVSAAYGQFVFYDNNAASGKVRLRIYVAQYRTIPIVFNHPIRFKRGLYLNFATSGDYAFVQYRTDY